MTDTLESFHDFELYNCFGNSVSFVYESRDYPVAHLIHCSKAPRAEPFHRTSKEVDLQFRIGPFR